MYFIDDNRLLETCPVQPFLGSSDEFSQCVANILKHMWIHGRHEQNYRSYVHAVQSRQMSLNIGKIQYR